VSAVIRNGRRKMYCRRAQCITTAQRHVKTRRARPSETSVVRCIADGQDLSSPQGGRQKRGERGHSKLVLQDVSPTGTAKSAHARLVLQYVLPTVRQDSSPPQSAGKNGVRAVMQKWVSENVSLTVWPIAVAERALMLAWCFSMYYRPGDKTLRRCRARTKRCESGHAEMGVGKCIADGTTYCRRRRGAHARLVLQYILPTVIQDPSPPQSVGTNSVSVVMRDLRCRQAGPVTAAER
jgi:hypothetical protein